jgi:hypothetical protein
MDAILAGVGHMSVHCGEAEYVALDAAVCALDGHAGSAVLAAECSELAARYMDQIANLSGAHRALLRSVVRLQTAGRAAAACEVALAVFGPMLRAHARFAKRQRPCRKWRRATRPY